MPATLEPPQPKEMAASGSFPEDQFVTFKGVPVFAEHVTQHNGRTLSFGPNELQAVVNRCNARIANTGDYAAICIGHTPDAEARSRGVPSPPCIGFAGPFSLGEDVDAQGNPRYLVLADFHIHREEVGEMRRHPRRSAELWIEDRYEDMFLDPIALLGSEPPRLDMGLLYQKFHAADGREVLKYSYAVPTSIRYSFPGSASSFVPAEVETKRHSAEDADMDPNQIVQEVVAAIAELPAMRWAQAKMDEEQGAGDSSGVDGQAPADDLTAAGPDNLNGAPGAAPAGMPPAGPAGAPPAAGPAAAPAIGPPATPSAQPAAPAAAAPVPPADPAPAPEAQGAAPPAQEEVMDPAEREKLQKYEAMDALAGDMTDEDIANYAAHRRKRRKGYEAAETIEESSVESANAQYAKSGDVARYQKEIGDLKAIIFEERGKRIDGERRAMLERLADRGIQLDVNEEMDRLKFSMMEDNKRFLQEVGRIQKNYGRLPHAISIELPELLAESAPTGDPARYSKANAERLSIEARKETLRRRNAGDSSATFESVFSELAGTR